MAVSGEVRSLLAAVILSGTACVTFPEARLEVQRTFTTQLAAPVVCGPVGFRRVPLQARWGEYVKVTVQSPVPLRGTAWLHADGVVGEPQAWTTEAGATVLEARFENLDPDRRFALLRDRPIDITIGGLDAMAGGTCEGAVFIVEQGVLMPSIDEASWLAELVRRGGPELAARRALARQQAEARREAHYAAWAARQHQPSAIEVEQRVALRDAHYAAWEARHGVAVQVEAGAVASMQEVGSTQVRADQVIPVGVTANANASASASASASVVVVQGASAPVVAPASDTSASASASATVVSSQEWVSYPEASAMAVAPSPVAAEWSTFPGSTSATLVAVPVSVESQQAQAQVQASSSVSVAVEPEIDQAEVIEANAAFALFDFVLRGVAAGLNSVQVAPPPQRVVRAVPVPPPAPR